MMQFSNHVLDHLTAPKLTSLTICGAREISELPDHDFTLRLNQAIGAVRYKNDHDVVLRVMFITRLKTAISEYKLGRQFLLKYVGALPGKHLLDAHRSALAHFENCILQLHVAIVSLAALGDGTKPVKVKVGTTPFFVGKGNSDYDRLRELNNRIKHFDENVTDAVENNNLVPLAPVWITNDGFECFTGYQLSFLEIEAIFEAQAKDAADFST